MSYYWCLLVITSWLTLNERRHMARAQSTPKYYTATQPIIVTPKVNTRGATVNVHLTTNASVAYVVVDAVLTTTVPDWMM